MGRTGAGRDGIPDTGLAPSAVPHRRTAIQCDPVVRHGLRPLLRPSNDAPSAVHQAEMGLVVIEFADFGVTDYNAPLVSPALTLNAAQAQELWDDICHSLPAADIVLFDKVPETILGRSVPLVQRKRLAKHV